jgi:hypothetical protein
MMSSRTLLETPPLWRLRPASATVVHAIDDELDRLERSVHRTARSYPVRAELVEALSFLLPAFGRRRAAPFGCLPRQALRTGFDKLRANGCEERPLKSRP